MYKILFGILAWLIVFVFPPTVFAQGEFSSSLDVFYDVDSSGVTTVTEQITLKNLTDRYYASSFSIVIGTTQTTDISAKDSQSTLPVTVTKVGNKTKIEVKFNQQISGKSKEYQWELKFKSKDFAEKFGKVWQVSVPKISKTGSINDYAVSLSVPVEFGDPTTIIPEPKKQFESGGKLVFQYNQDQLIDSGVMANFGTSQILDYKLSFDISNNNRVLPAIAKLPLPMNTPYQKVLISQIKPKPENVALDSDGNYIGTFKLDPNQSTKVEVTGMVKLFIKSQTKDQLSKPEIDKLTATNKYWEKDNQQIKTKLEEILKQTNPKTNQEKARTVDKFVTGFLSYDQDRLKNSDYQRLGALTALLNPNRALCNEFTDLFVTLSRASGVPARSLVGYAYTSNQELRPLSFQNSILHAWPQYFDPNIGWVMIDPTWENTTGGVDYFSKFDLNHFVLAIRGADSDNPVPPDQISIQTTESAFEAKSKVNIIVDVSPQIFAGFPTKGKITIKNSGNSIADASRMEISTNKLQNSGDKSSSVPAIPPQGFVEQQFDLNSPSLWSSYEDILQVKVGNESIVRKIVVKPFFAYKYFVIILVGTISAILFIYLTVLMLHLKSDSLKQYKRK